MTKKSTLARMLLLGQSCMLNAIILKQKIICLTTTLEVRYKTHLTQIIKSLALKLALYYEIDVLQSKTLNSWLLLYRFLNIGLECG